MGSRPSQFKKGGGRLNGVEVTINGYEFTGDEIKFVEGGGLDRTEFTPGKVKGKDNKPKDKFHSLNCLLSLRVDGADVDITEPLFVGNADDWAISEDGQQIWDPQYADADAAREAEEADPKSARQLGQGTAFSEFIASLVKAGFPESSLPEFGFDFSGIVRTRVKVVQVEDPRKKGQVRKGKDGKDYKYTITVVDDVLALPGDPTQPEPKKAQGAKTGTAKPAAGKTTAAKPAAGKAAASKKADTSAIDAKVTTFLLDTIRAQGELVEDSDPATMSLETSKLSMAILKHKGWANNNEREDARKRIAAVVNGDVTLEGVEINKADGVALVAAE